ncbi:TPR-like protein [Paraphaeosphaeria sporulosa]|uniref:TPR-like protein n=1 Tax=Paraphaeosphaeria sporulosa TaxID=1460663 RepID=A0A177C2A4_9PLEO|nr:TPR-like protein [Paraphaeosphaeria sporulosa]OAG00992.1 TPR-like protein [Paraphaeosphaeria sporulosa]
MAKNKTLSKAINSMFQWYKNAIRCYVFLSDVSVSTATEPVQRSDWEASFRKKLIAPPSVEFFSCEGQPIGDKASLDQLIHEITGIPLAALRNYPLDQFTTSERERWAENRRTTEEEDIVYCLLGILGVYMRTAYGEGQESARSRLQVEVVVVANVPSIIPFLQNPRFVGRESQLAELEGKLFSNEQTTTTLAIVGPGGLGKSQLALEVAHKIRQNMDNCLVFWMDELLYLPLAIAQAAACINASGIIVQNYQAQLDAYNDAAIDHSSDSPTDNDDEERLDLLWKCALALYSDGRYEEAEELFVQVMETSSRLNVQVMETFKRVLGEEHHSTLTSMANLASTFSNQGRWNEAEELEVQLMETSLRVLGKEHPSTLTSMNNLASMYRNQGRWKEAEELEVQVMETRERVLGEQHPDTLTSMANLASTYKDQGRWKEAEELEVQVMETRERVLGEQHPDTLTSMANLASTYKDQGRWKEAEELEVQVMETRERVLGEQHPDTLTSMGNLASTYMNQGRWNEAEELEVQVMETRERVLGEEHPSTLTSMANLATTYLKQGRWKEAEELNVQVMETRKREAEELNVQVMETRKRVLGEQHPDTLTSMGNLASTYMNQGRWNEAEELEVQVMETRERVLGEEHPSTLTSMANLASTFSNQGRWNKAEELECQARHKDALVLMERCFRLSQQVLGKQHPDTQSSLGTLASWRADCSDENS